RQMEQELADEQLNAEIIRNKRGITIRLSDSLLFDLGNAELKPQSRKVLDRVAELLKANPRNVVIEGHTDDVPIGPSLRKKFPTNWELSTTRATNVLRYFVEGQKMQPDRFSASGYGEFRPLSPNRIGGKDNPEGRNANRRVDIVILEDEATGGGSNVR
ncbi:MAG: OmpA family protein, partial [Candidatus Wallbacteria bacterium]|nr:OmpA family protein [Candidatus Wallbacteria bacterium]